MDANHDFRIDISDPIYLLNHLFLGGDSPPAPFPDCGVPTVRPGSESCQAVEDGCV